jgi:hypothetical protein
MCQYCGQAVSAELLRTAVPCPRGECRTLNAWGATRCLRCTSWIVVQCIFCGGLSPDNRSECLSCREPFYGAPQRKAARDARDRAAARARDGARRGRRRGRTAPWRAGGRRDRRVGGRALGPRSLARAERLRELWRRRVRRRSWRRERRWILRRDHRVERRRRWLVRWRLVGCGRLGLWRKLRRGRRGLRLVRLSFARRDRCTASYGASRRSRARSRRRIYLRW